MRAASLCALAALCLMTQAVFAQTPAAGVAQPPISGTWKLNPEKSTGPKRPDATETRRYFLRDDGYLVGLLFSGTPRELHWLQFTVKSDGQDYQEYSDVDVANLIAKGTKTPRTYGERKIDDYTTEWVDKIDGKVTAKGRKIVSKDLKTLTITVETQSQPIVRVYDRQ